ncbi:CapA family protein [Nioella aestuarii]|uniref:CapA family protein n=1 Tax=Nioella aestuarii TaxID=1662864 RepID=UPI003D7F718A
MTDRLPDCPDDVLQVSAPPLRAILAGFQWLANRRQLWRYPSPKAATAAEEMSVIDNLYWIYKTSRPITEYERDMPGDLRPDTTAPQAMLPEGFAESTSLSMGAGGDLLRSAGIDGSQDRLFENVADLLFDQDISFANFESPVTTQPLVDEVIGDQGPPTECCSATQFDILTSHKGKRFDILNTANNHMFDMGVEGVETTLATMADRQIMPLGTNAMPDDYGKALIITRGGIKIGFAAAAFGLNGRDLPEAERYRINISRLLSKKGPPDLSLLKRQIDDCKAEGCDFIIASVHWGFEFELFPRAVQIKAARDLVEYGADSILCHHPHVIQPVEYYRPARDPDRVAVIAHSLGSLTWGFMAPHIVLSTILTMRLAKGKKDGEVRTYLAEVTKTPVFRSYVEEDGQMITRLEKLADHVGNPDSPHPQPYLQQVQAFADLVRRG